MKQVNFNGIKGKIIESSEHGNYLVIKISERISICGTYSNIWKWEEIPDLSSGFRGFLTYIGFNTDSVAQKYLDLIHSLGGYCKTLEDQKRIKKRVKGKFRYEMKVRNLTPDDVINLLNIK
jgi:hypothetical protein